MEFKSTQQMPKRQAKVRFRFFNQDPNQVRQFQEFTNDNGNTWNVSYALPYFRKKE